MPKRHKPVLRHLSPREARALLARLDVGRIAYVFHDHVDIEPIHYAADGERIYGRTSIGSKLISLVHHRWCAFEVDDVHGPFDWMSVVVKGAFYVLDAEPGPDGYARCLALLRAKMPEALTSDDPAPHRAVLFRIHIDEIAGRCADSSRAPGSARRALLMRGHYGEGRAAPNRARGNGGKTVD
jgi:hypothetical protein